MRYVGVEELQVGMVYISTTTMGSKKNKPLTKFAKITAVGEITSSPLTGRKNKHFTADLEVPGMPVHKDWKFMLPLLSNVRIK